MNSLLQNPKTKPVFILILVFALVIRLVGIASRPIWYDEAFSILFSEKGLSAMLYGTLTQIGVGTADIHPLGYYTLLWTWMKVFGQSILAARLFSIFTSLASLILVYKIASNLFNEKTAITAALLTSVLPFQVHFAQEIRMYSLLSLWLLIATFSFLHGRTKNWKWWILFAVSSALAQYTHNLAFIYLIPLALTPLIQKDFKTLKSVLFASLLSITLYLPWLTHLPAQFSKVNSSYWVERPGVEKFFTLLLVYLPNLPLPNKLLLPGLLIAALTVTLASFQTILAKKRNLLGTDQAIWLVYLAFIPPLLLWTISQFVPVYIERALLPSHFIFCIWLAWVFTQTPSPRLIQSLAMAFIAISSVMGFYQHITYTGFPYGPFPSLNNSIQARMKPKDIVIHSSKLSYLPSFYYDQTPDQGYIIDLPGSNVDSLAPATREVLQLNEFDSIQKATTNADRIWFIIFQNSIDEYTLSGNITHPHLEYLDSNFTLESVETWNDLKLYLYIRNKSGNNQ